MTESEIRTRLSQIATLLQRTANQRAELDRKWSALVAERICLQHRLDLFEVHHAATQT